MHAVHGHSSGITDRYSERTADYEAKNRQHLRQIESAPCRTALATRLGAVLPASSASQPSQHLCMTLEHIIKRTRRHTHTHILQIHTLKTCRTWKNPPGHNTPNRADPDLVTPPSSYADRDSRAHAVLKADAASSRCVEFKDSSTYYTHTHTTLKACFL